MTKKSDEHSIPCIQEKRIDKIEKDVTEIKTSLNGTDGLMAIVVKQVQITDTQGENIDKLVNMVDVLRVKDIETDKEKEVKKSIRKENEDLKKYNRNQLRWFIGILLTVIGLALTIIKIID